MAQLQAANDTTAAAVIIDAFFFRYCSYAMTIVVIISVPIIVIPNINAAAATSILSLSK